MAFYDKFPYTNFQEINLDRLIQELIKVKEGLDFVIENASLKYADPIQWNITHQYAANTVVIDPETGIAYISTRPVPDNILITNTGYWTPIFDLSTFFDDTEQAIDTINTNIDTINSNIDTINTNIDALDADLETTDTNLDNLTNRVNNIESLAIVNIFPNVAAMQAANISAGSEVMTMGYYEPGDGGSGTYEIKLSGTADNMAVFAMENGNFAHLNIADNSMLNIKQLGAKADGTADISGIVNAFTANYPLFVPVGIYAVNNSLNLKNSLVGEVSGRFSATGAKGSVIRSALNAGGTINISGTVHAVTIKDLEIYCTSDADGVYFHPNSYDHAKIENITIRNFTKNAINISPAVSMSRAVYINECTLIAEPWTNTVGIYMNSNTADCRISDTEIMGVQRGIVSYASSLIVSNIHIWNSNTGTSALKNQWWGETRGIVLYTTKFVATNLYIDCPRFIFNLPDGKATITVNNIFTWADDTIDSGIDSSNYDGTFILLGTGSDQTYNFNGGIIYCDLHHLNMFNTSVNRQIKFNNVKFVIREQNCGYLNVPAQSTYVMPNLTQIDNGEVLIPNYGGSFMPILEYFSDWACYDVVRITGPDNQCIELELKANSVTKKVLGGNINAYYLRFASGARYVTRIYLPTASGYFISKVQASMNANTRVFAYAIRNNAPFKPATKDDASDLTLI